MASETPETMNQKLIWNKPYGHTGGKEFKAVQSGKEDYVTEMEVYTRQEGDNLAIKAITLRWSNNKETTFGQKEGQVTKETTTFQKTERIIKMVIYAGDWVDSIYYESTRIPGGWRAGGRGGSAHEQKTGDGVLVGFWGTAGNDVDKLGAVFGGC